MPEIEKYIMTSDEAAAITAAVMSTIAVLIAEMDEKTIKLLPELQSGLHKVMALQDELKKGVEDARKEGTYA